MNLELVEQAIDAACHSVIERNMQAWEQEVRELALESWMVLYGIRKRLDAFAHRVLPPHLRVYYVVSQRQLPAEPPQWSEEDMAHFRAQEKKPMFINHIKEFF